MKKVINCLILACVIVSAVGVGYSIIVPAIKIDGVPYDLDKINNGVSLLNTERDSFYRELKESTDREIRAFLSERDFPEGYLPSSNISENRLKGIIQKKIEAAQKQDALFQEKFTAILNENRLRFSIPYLQVKRDVNYDEFHSSLFQLQFTSVILDEAEFDEAALTLIREYTAARRKELTTRALGEIKNKFDTIGAKMLENLGEQKSIKDEADIDDLISAAEDFHTAASILNSYNSSLLSECRISEQNKGYMLPVNFSAGRPIREEFMYESDFDKFFLKTFMEFHEKIKLGFKDYYLSGFNKIVTAQIEQMESSLSERRNTDRGIDFLQAARFSNEIIRQSALYENIGYSILERSLGNYGTAVSTPVSYESPGEAAIFQLNPLPQDYAVVDNGTYYEAPLRMMGRALASYSELFTLNKNLNYEQEAHKLRDRQISNIMEGRDVNAGVSAAGLSSLVKYYYNQASNTGLYAKLFEQFRTDNAVNQAAPIPVSYAPEPRKNPFDAFRSVINVSLPFIDAEYYNELLLDRDAARIMNADIDAVRDEWNRITPERKKDIIQKRLDQYQQNINARRNVKFGVNSSELKEYVAWEERQRTISGSFFPSLLIESCSLKSIPEIAAKNPDVGVIDVSPLPVNARTTDGIAFDSDLAGGVENMAVILSKSLVGNINNKVTQTVRHEMDTLRRNAVEYAYYRYKIGTRIGLTLSEWKEACKDFFLSGYQKRHPEAELFFSYMQRDFDLEEQLVQDLYWAQKQQADLNTALINDYMACSLNNDNYLITGAADPTKVIDSNKLVMDYINDVFSLLLNTQANIRFVKTESMEEIWGPAFALSIGIGLIPGVGLLADIVIGLGIDIAACLVEKNLKKNEYAASIVQLVTYEEQKLLQNINRYGGTI